MIEVEELEFHYPDGDFELRIPELSLPEKPRIGLVGPSGSGKTTFLHLIAGILTPRRGRISVRGVEVTEMQEWERRDFRSSNIGLIFQQFELLGYLTVLENILLPFFVNFSLDLTEDVEEFAREQAHAAGIATELDRYPDQLSQGERQRVAVCRALVTEPDLILADEPAGNLDPETTEEIMSLINEQVRTQDAVLLLATHEHSLLSQFEEVIDFETFESQEARVNVS